MDAYVYLRADPGKLEDVVIELAGKHGVRRAVAVVGDWDIMVAVEGADFHAVARTVLAEIHPIEGIAQTYTAPVVPLEMIGIHGGGWAIPSIPMHADDGEVACYVHISAAAGSVAGIVEALAEMETISGVAVVAGRYDVVAEIPLPWEQASRVILEDIHGIPGVESTNTAVGLPPVEGEDE